MGFAIYLSEYIPNFSIISEPIYRLFCKGQLFDWAENQQKAFAQLKQTLASEPVREIFNTKEKTELHTDASTIGVTGILFQKKHPIGYFSRRRSKAKSNYTATELESLANINAIDHFRIYLEGIPFTLVTDHSALKWLLKFQKTKRRFFRWAKDISTYTFEVVHKSGRLMQHVDALS